MSVILTADEVNDLNAKINEDSNFRFKTDLKRGTFLAVYQNKYGNALLPQWAYNACGRSFYVGVQRIFIALENYDGFENALEFVRDN